MKWRRLCVTALFEKLDGDKLEDACTRLVDVLQDVAPNNVPHQITIVMALLATLADVEGYSITVLLDAVGKLQDKKNKGLLQ